MTDTSPLPSPEPAPAHWSERLVEGADAPLLILALVSVVLYLGELQSLGEGAALGAVLVGLSRIIDVVFLCDFVLKLVVLRRRYVPSPWALIDLVSTLPALELLGLIDGLSGARFVRVFRFFRMLRTIRVVRVIGLTHLSAIGDQDIPEQRALHRAMYMAVGIYTALFYAILFGAGPDSANDAEFYVILGSLLGMLLVLVVMRYQVREISARHVRALLNIALPRQVADHLIEYPEAVHNTVHMPATIVFCDLVGFTQAVEALEGDLVTLKRHLERAFDAVVQAHTDHDLIVDKFIGDAVMSFRGGDLVEGTPQEHAERVVRASLHAARALRALEDPYFKEMKFGGASAESVIIGTFGTSSRLSYTALGDGVNLAARLEGSCGQLGAGNVFDQRTASLTEPCEDFSWRPLGSVRVKGQGDAHPVFEALEPQDCGVWLEHYLAGLDAYQTPDFLVAAGHFAESNRTRSGGDGPSRMYLKLCEALDGEGVTDDWTATLSMRK